MKPNKLQQEVINHITSKDGKRILLVEAPPGTGKTYTAIASASKYIETVIDSTSNRKVLVLTFSKNAKAQLDKQVNKLELSPKITKKIEITNFHSFFQKYVWAYSKYLGLGSELNIVSPLERERQLKTTLTFIKWYTGTKENIYIEQINWINDVLENAHLIPNCRSNYSDVKKLVSLRDKIKEHILALNRLGHLSFSDIAYHFNVLMEKSPKLLSVIKNKYPLIILDEYQDSSDLQDLIVRKIIGDTGRALFFADPKQMIHEWRGASSNRLLNLKNSYYTNEIKQMTLTENMRFKDCTEIEKFLKAIRNGSKPEIGCTGDRLIQVNVPVEEMDIFRPQVKNSMYSSMLFKVFNYLKKENVSNGSIGVLCVNNELVKYLRKNLREKFNYRSKDISNNDEEHNMVGKLNLFIKSLETESESPQFNDYFCRTVFDLLFDVVYDTNIGTIKKNKLKDIDLKKVKGCKVNLLKEISLCIQDAITSKKYLTSIDKCLNLAKIYNLQINPDSFNLLKKILRTGDCTAESITKVFLHYQHTKAYKDLKGLYILNIHQSKGREFDTVYVIDAPDINKDPNLLYVATSRMKKKLLLFDWVYKTS